MKICANGNYLNLQTTHTCVIVVPDGLEADGKTGEALMGEMSPLLKCFLNTLQINPGLRLCGQQLMCTYDGDSRASWVQGKHIGVFFNGMNIDFFS